MNDDNKLLLLNKYQRNELTEAEATLFFAWYHQADAAELHRLLAFTNDPPQYEEASPAFLEALEQKLLKTAPVKQLYPRRWLWAAAAAVVLIIAGSLYWLVQNKATEKPAVATTTQAPDVAPGRNGAVLTLSDGRRILLDSLGHSQVIDEKGARINIKEGSITYDASDAAAVVYNTVSTPVARQFKLVLPDQSVVWLNAGSSIRYPSAFTGQTREVEMTGEAYFEVSKDASRPFRVKVNNKTTVEVLGTHFNVNAYDDEPSTRVTLLEGKVVVGGQKSDVGGQKSDVGSQKSDVGSQKSDVGGRSSVVLKPGEQAVVSEHSPLTIDHSPDVAQVVAWKNGIFNFNQLETKEVMRQIARWYDVEVVYEPGVSSHTFYGEIGRNLSLGHVLEGLKISGVNCRIEGGKKLIVLP